MPKKLVFFLSLLMFLSFSLSKRVKKERHTEEYTLKLVQHSQAFFLFADQANAKTPVRYNRYHNTSTSTFSVKPGFLLQTLGTVTCHEADVKIPLVCWQCEFFIDRHSCCVFCEIVAPIPSM